MKKVLHLSHHYGCLKDHQYICNELGLDLTSNFSVWDTILPKGVFKITKKVANDIWNDNEDLFKSFDYITTSDTAPLSRIVLENIKKFDGILNIWVCNRFDYNMETDSKYTDLIRKYSDHPQVNLIPYSEFERFWLNRKNITTKQETIRPIGLALQTPLIEDEDHIIGFDGDYKFEKTSGDVLVSRYHNDNIFQDSKKICESFGFTAQHARYRGAQELNSLVENYECFMIFPDAYSKLTAFELMQLKMPVILPSEGLLLKMSMKPNYFFSTGVVAETVRYCEWYNEYFEQFAVYYEEMEGIGDAVQMVKDNKEQIRDIMDTCSRKHTEVTLNQWSKVYETV